MKPRQEKRVSDSAKFLASLLQNIADNFSEGIQKIKFDYGHDNKKNVKTVELNTKIISAILSV